MIIQYVISSVFDRLFLYQVVASLSTYLCIITAHLLIKRSRRFALMREYGIPMEDTSIIHGHYHLYKSYPAMFTTDEKFMRKFGKVYGMFVGDDPNIVVTDKNLLQKIFIDNSRSFKERTRLFVNTPLSSGVLFAEHDRWRVLRGLLLPAFSSYSVRSDSSTQFIEESLKYLLDYIETKRKKVMLEGKRLELDLHRLMKSVTLHMISALAVQLPEVQVNENEPHVNDLDSFLTVADEGAVNLVIKFPFLRCLIEFIANNFEYATTMSSIHKALDSLIDRKISSNTIVSKQQQQQPSKLIDHLIKSYKQGKLSRNELISTVDSLLIAGYDTTSSALTYLLWVLGKNLDIQDRLRGELSAYGTESDYLLQVINETMRLYPSVVIFTSRMATETVTIDNLTIPQGAKVIFNTRLMHRHPDLWDQPDKFDPDRFAKDKVIHPCAFAPFGLGDRKCIGFQLSLLEMRMIVCDLVLRYRIKTLAPDVLKQKSHAYSLSAPLDRVLVELEKL